MKSLWRAPTLGLVLLAAGCSATPQGQPQSRRYPKNGVPAAARSHLALTSGPAGSCRRLRVSFGRPISPVTGEEGFILRFENVSQVACSLKGYPQLALLGANGRLPFAWTDGKSPGPYFLSRPPRPVELAPKHAAHVMVAKYRRDLGVLKVARAVIVKVGGGGQGANLRLPHSMPYCRGGRQSPGNTVGVTPYVTSLSSVLP
jgi:hypothetical protein